MPHGRSTRENANRRSRAYASSLRLLQLQAPLHPPPRGELEEPGALTGEVLHTRVRKQHGALAVASNDHLPARDIRGRAAQ